MWYRSFLISARLENLYCERIPTMLHICSIQTRFLVLSNDYLIWFLSIGMRSIILLPLNWCLPVFLHQVAFSGVLTFWIFVCLLQAREHMLPSGLFELLLIIPASLAILKLLPSVVSSHIYREILLRQSWWYCTQLQFLFNWYLLSHLL